MKSKGKVNVKFTVLS